MAQEITTHRVLTIAGSVALVALTAYGVWKWNKSDVVKEDDKKKKTRQVEKQSRPPTQEKETIEELERIVEAAQAVPEEGVAEQVVTEDFAVEKVLVKQVPIELTVVEPTPVEQAVFEQVEVEAEEEVAKVQPTVVIESEQVVIESEPVTAAVKEEEEEYVVVAKREESQSCATSSTDETDVWTPEHESDHKNNTPEAAITPVTEEYIWKADATSTSNTEEEKDWASSTIVTCSKLSSDAPVFVPRQQAIKKHPKKRLTRSELIEQQRQNHTPHAKARCSHWPRCTNKNCKFWHPFRDCREGETCPFGNKCMFIHPSDYVEPPRVKKNQASDEEDQSIQQEQFQFAA